MICFLALIAFGILGIFSATHRKVAFEAFDCVFKRVRFKPCDSGLDRRIKSQITGKLINKNTKLARFVFNNFEIVSWIFTVLLILSFVYSGIGTYNFIVYGNCNGESSNEACFYNGVAGIFNNDKGCEAPLCSGNECKCENLENCLNKTLCSCNTDN